MKKLFENIKFRWELMSGRYQFLIAENQKDVEACIQILEEVRRKELNRVAGKSVLDSGAFSGEQVDFQLAACRDTNTGKIIGCMRITDAWSLRNIPASVAEYHLDEFPETLLKKLKIFTRLAVLKPYRKSAAGFFTMFESFRLIQSQDYEAALMSCEPNLFPLYKTLGLRAIGPPHNSSSGGYRIPMAFFTDLEHLKKIKSPSLIIKKQLDFEKGALFRAWFKDLELGKHKTQLGISPYSNEVVNERIVRIITKGLSKDGKKKFLKNALIVKCKEGDVIVAENDGGKFFGIVKNGLVNVEVGGNPIGLLEEGNIFGEVAFVLKTNRTATLLAAAPKTEVLLFSLSALKRLEKKSDRLAVWQNLAIILAERLVERTNLLSLRELSF